jgi:RNA polymerase sigma-70 factor (ECF subfamily)
MSQTATATMPAASRQRDDDRDLVQRYLGGDVRAFDELMTRHERRVFGLCFRFVKNREDALDLTQEVFIKAFENLPSFRGDARFKTWIYRVAVNHCLNHVKKNAREFIEVTDSIGSVKPLVHNKLLTDERRELVRGMMDCLPPRQRAILELRMNENLSYDEIATILDRSVSMIKSSVFFALGKLKKLVKQSAIAGKPL